MICSMDGIGKTPAAISMKRGADFGDVGIVNGIIPVIETIHIGAGGLLERAEWRK